MASKSAVAFATVIILTAFAGGVLVGWNWNPTVTGIISLPAQQNQNSSLSSLTPTDSYKSTINIVAVRAQDNQGILNQAVVELRPGNGRVLFAVNPFIETDTQQSAETAASVAQQLTGKSLKAFELIYAIENTDAQLVGGPSAGAALAVATIAAIEQKSVKSDVAITGTIESNGSIGQIGGVLEKADAAGQAGIKLFLVPKGQANPTVYQPKTVQERYGRTIVTRTRYVQATIDLNAYASENYGMQVIEVGTVQEAEQYLIA